MRPRLLACPGKIRVGRLRSMHDGRRRLREETAGWNRLASAIAAALNTKREEV